MPCVVHKAITLRTCTVVPPLMLDPSPGDSLQVTAMLLKLCNHGMMKPQGGECLWGIHSSSLTMRRQCYVLWGVPS